MFANMEVAFSEELPVRLRIQDREPHVASLSVRVAVEPGPSPVLSVLLTDVHGKLQTSCGN